MAKQKKTNYNTYTSSSSYFSDLHDEATLYAVLVRSPISSGTIRTISIQNIPEDYMLFTSDDLINDVPINVIDTTFPVFARNKISYKGEPIGILTGPNLTTLHELLDTIQIIYTETFEEGEKDILKKVIAKRSIEYGTKKALKNNLEHHIDSHSSLQIDIEEINETNGALCYANGKKLTVYTPTLWPSNLRQNLHEITGYASENIIIHKTKLPITDKNATWKNTTLAVQCAIASILTKKSVLLFLSQEEQKLYDDPRNIIDIHHSSKVNNEGTIVSCDISIQVDVGAYNPIASVIIDRLAIAAMGAYSASKLNIEVIAIKSDKPPASSIVKWLDYHCFYAIETHMREIANKINISPDEIRMKNILTKNKHHPFQHDCDGYEKALLHTVQRSDFYRKYEAYKLNPYTELSKMNFFPVRGIGLATAYEANGFLGSITDANLQNIEVSIEKNGKVIIKVLNTSDTIASIWKDIASSILSVSLDDIVIDNISYQNEEANVPDTMLNNIYITSQLLKKACLAVQKQRFHQPLPITVKRKLSGSNKKIWNQDTFKGKPFYATSWIALVAEVELILPTYAYEVRNIWITIDSGNVMNKKRARYAIHSCVKKILSHAMKDQAYSEPDISVTFLDSNDEPKQIRELVYSALPAAISNALSQALQHAMHTYPIAQDSIFSIIKNISENTDIITVDSIEEDMEDDNDNTTTNQ